MKGYLHTPDFCLAYFSQISLYSQLRPPKLVLAHMGGWNCQAEAENHLAGRDIWLDTSFSLLPLCSAPHAMAGAGEKYRLSPESFLRMAKKHGANRILFGSDSPWGGQAETIAALKSTGLSDAGLSAVLGGNAAGLLRL